MTIQINSPERKNAGAVGCQLVDRLDMIIGKFVVAQSAIVKLDYVEWDGKVFARKHADGGGPPTFYEISPVKLSERDVDTNKPRDNYYGFEA